MGVDLFGDLHRENDDGFNWARLSDARSVEISSLVRPASPEGDLVGAGRLALALPLLAAASALVSCGPAR
jgi:hypothetical protein